MGLYKGEVGGKQFRRTLTEQAREPDAGLHTLEVALEVVAEARARSAA